MDFCRYNKLFTKVVSKESSIKSYPEFLPKAIINIIELYRQDILNDKKQDFYIVNLSKSFQNTKAMKIKLIQQYLNKIQLNTRKIDSKGISIFFQTLSKHQGYKNTN